MLAEDPAIESFTKYGTAMMGDFTNKIGGLPTRNFSSGQAFNEPEGRFKSSAQALSAATGQGDLHSNRRASSPLSTRPSVGNRTEGEPLVSADLGLSGTGSAGPASADCPGHPAL